MVLVRQESVALEIPNHSISPNIDPILLSMSPRTRKKGQIYLDTDQSAGKEISTVAQIPANLKCFTITNPHVNDPGGHFKIEIQFSDWLHEIDHSVNIYNSHSYEICYKLFPATLKLIIGDSGFRSSFDLLKNMNSCTFSMLKLNWAGLASRPDLWI